MVKLASLRGTIGHLIINTLRYFIEERKEKDLIIISTLKKDISNKFVYKLIKNHFEKDVITVILQDNYYKKREFQKKDSQQRHITS